MRNRCIGPHPAIGIRPIIDARRGALQVRESLSAQPHDPDVKALLRIAQVYDIPIANNRATADFIITSPFMESAYKHMLMDFRGQVDERAKNL